MLQNFSLYCETSVQDFSIANHNNLRQHHYNVLYKLNTLLPVAADCEKVLVLRRLIKGHNFT